MHVALVSAKNATALDAACTRLADHLRANPDENIADVCHTLATGRSLYQFARIASCSNAEEAAEALELERPVHGRRRSARRFRSAGDVSIPRARLTTRLHGTGALQRRAGLPARDRQLRRTSQAASWERFALTPVPHAGDRERRPRRHYATPSLRSPPFSRFPMRWRNCG